MGLESIFGGGYVGVDVFFVISGYLITSIIHRDLQAGRFTLSGFYERRILRILPALFTVTAVSAALGWIVLFPADLAYFGQTLAATAGFSSNILFWLESGYFAPDSNNVALLHTWSLAVEEQFYILFPLILMALAGGSARLRMAVIAALFVVSFLLSVMLLGGHKSFTFYMLPTRAWELMAGSMLALVSLPRVKTERAMQALSVLGILLIFAAVTLYDEGTDFPGFAALLPVMGAGLVLYTGSHGLYAAQKLLTMRPVMFFGRISYSLYLWHWPLIVFFKYGTPWDLSGFWIAALFALCVALSYLTWRFIEQPARKQIVWRGQSLFALTVLLCVLWGGAGLVLTAKEGIPMRFLPDMLTLLTREDVMTFPLMSGVKDSAGSGRILGQDGGRASFVLWGDSHADAGAAGLHAKALEEKSTGYLFGYQSCFPSVVPMEDMEPVCNDLNSHNYDFLRKNPDIEHVILVARWQAYYNRLAGRREKGRESYDLPFDHYLGETIAALGSAGKKVYVVAEVPPAPTQSIHLYLVRQMRYGRDFAVYTDLHDYLVQQEKVRAAFERLAVKHSFVLIEPHKTMCQGRECPLMGNGRSYYYDDDHISAYGALRFKDMYGPVFY